MNLGKVVGMFPIGTVSKHRGGRILWDRLEIATKSGGNLQRTRVCIRRYLRLGHCEYSVKVGSVG